MNNIINTNILPVLFCCNRKNNNQVVTSDNNKNHHLGNTPRYVAGLIYEDIDGELGFYDYGDNDLNRIIEKSFFIIKRGKSSYPAIPVSAKPRILYLFDNVKKRNIGDLFDKGNH